MKIRIAMLCLLLMCSPAFTSGETLREVELSDGSVVRAEVIGMHDGVYLMRSQTLGEFEVPESQVVTIRTAGSRPASGAATPAPSDWKIDTSDIQPLPQSLPSAGELQQVLSQDPAAMNQILSLQDDPLVQSILGDAGTMQAVQSGDLGALLNDPKIKALMEHPTVQGLSQEHE